MPAYISQGEAALYAESVGSMSAQKAISLLSAASTAVDNFCGRTFTGAELTDDVKASVAMLAEWLATSNPSGGVITSEKIGDYTVNYATPKADGLPMAIQMMLAPYKVVAVG